MTDFFKVSGAGNDFIALAGPEGEPVPAQIIAWCRRGLSIGADGLVTLERTERGARMGHYNADGGRSDLCLNGSRCAAQLAFHLGWHERTLELVTDAGSLAARHVDETRVGLVLPPIIGAPERRVLEVEDTSYDGFRLDVGVPHFVVPWPDGLGSVPLGRLGPALRHHEALMPTGANVSFVDFVSAERFEIRTFERGVEGETLACGTGVVAAAVASAEEGRITFPVTALTSGGFELTVRKDGERDRIELIGDARIVARGEILEGAVRLPDRPTWRA